MLKLDDYRKMYEGRDERFKEVTEPLEALRLFNTQKNQCWAVGKAGKTGWYRVGYEAGVHPGQASTVYVCKAELLEPLFDQFAKYHKKRVLATGFIPTLPFMADWHCPNCGTGGRDSAFHTCLEDGELVEPTEQCGWKDLYKCMECNQIIKQADGE